VDNPIFQNTTQAVHFSFLMEALEPGAESAMGKIIRRRLEELGLATGERSESTIDFGGLTALEVRGQAAMIRGAINHHLPGPEGWAIKSKYGLTKTIEKSGKPRVHVFSPERIDAMRKLSRLIAPRFSTVPSNAIIWLIAKSHGEIAPVRPTFRDIEEQAGGSKSELCRVYPQIKLTLTALENRGIDQLTPLFQQEGLVPNP